MIPSGYSQTPLAKKLGIKPGYKISLINEPEYYFKLFTDLPGDLVIVKKTAVKKDIIHYFVKEQTKLFRDLVLLKEQINQNGMIWVSWPKKTAKVATDISEDIIRNLALDIGLVDIKVCAVDEIWSGLKLVIPLKDRIK